MVLTLILSLLAPSTSLYAQNRTFPIDQLPPMRGDGSQTDDNNDDDTGLMPRFPGLGNNGNNSGNGNSTRPQNGPRRTTNVISPAIVPSEFACPLFESPSLTEIFTAIDALSKEVKGSPACSGNPSGQSLEDSTKAIQESVVGLMDVMKASAAGDVNVGQIDENVTAAIGALGNIGNVINNNEFLNSDCGRQTMSTGRLLLALNDVIAGMGPFALLAVSMNGALAPALPFVVGAVVGTTGISALAKMFNKKLIDMNNPEHRKAIVQNTCQFVKVSEKVRYLQLAQAGRMDQINTELSTKINRFSTELSQMARTINTSISERNTYLSAVDRIEQRMNTDRAELTSLLDQANSNDDKFLTCILANEMSQWGRDGQSFPLSAFKNFETIASQSDRSMQAQSKALLAFHHANVTKINQYAKDSTNDSAISRCATAAKSWFSGIDQALKLTETTIASVKVKVEQELSKSPEYVAYQTQSKKLEGEKSLMSKVQKALEELSRDSSIIDRSEISQRLVVLKSGLFNGQSYIPYNGFNSLVQQWINHTKRIHDQTLASVAKDLQILRDDSYSLTDAGKILSDSSAGSAYVNLTQDVGSQSYQASRTLSNFTLKNLPKGSREHELVCQKLQTAILDYTAAMDHLGSIDLFCSMIDRVLDSKVDQSIITSCRGQGQINGTVHKESLVNIAKAKMVSQGFQAAFSLIRKREAELKCALPSASILNQ